MQTKESNYVQILSIILMIKTLYDVIDRPSMYANVTGTVCGSEVLEYLYGVWFPSKLNFVFEIQICGFDIPIFNSAIQGCSFEIRGIFNCASQPCSFINRIVNCATRFTFAGCTIVPLEYWVSQDTIPVTIQTSSYGIRNWIVVLRFAITTWKHSFGTALSNPFLKQNRGGLGITPHWDTLFPAKI